MRVVVGFTGAVLVALMLREYFVTWVVPRQLRHDTLLVRRLIWLLWLPWRGVARRLDPSRADALLGLFGPLALLMQLAVWALGLMIGYGQIEWALAGGTLSERFLSSSGLFFGEASSGSVGVRVVELLEVATGVGVLFILIGYMPAVYTAFAQREAVVSQLAARAGTPPAAGALLERAARRGSWGGVERDLETWEGWAAVVMETHLTYPLLAFCRSQDANQSWLAALTSMVDVAAFLTACVPDENGDAVGMTFTIGRRAFASAAVQFRLEPIPVDRLSERDFETLFEMVERSTIPNLDRDTVRDRLERCREQYEPNAQALAHELAFTLPRWSDADQDAGSTRSCESGSSASGSSSSHINSKGVLMATVTATWEPHTTHGHLTKQSDLPDSVFAFPKERKEPLTDAQHVRNAVARFDQVIDVSDADRDLAWANIEKAAQYYDVNLSETDWHQLDGYSKTGSREK
jgi:hypothetical protein